MPDFLNQLSDAFSFERNPILAQLAEGTKQTFGPPLSAISDILENPNTQAALDAYHQATRGMPPNVAPFASGLDYLLQSAPRLARLNAPGAAGALASVGPLLEESPQALKTGVRGNFPKRLSEKGLEEFLARLQQTTKALEQQRARGLNESLENVPANIGIPKKALQESPPNPALDALAFFKARYPKIGNLVDDVRYYSNSKQPTLGYAEGLFSPGNIRKGLPEGEYAMKPAINIRVPSRATRQATAKALKELESSGVAPMPNRDLRRYLETIGHEFTHAVQKERGRTYPTKGDPRINLRTYLDSLQEKEARRGGATAVRNLNNLKELRKLFESKGVTWRGVTPGSKGWEDLIKSFAPKGRIPE